MANHEKFIDSMATKKLDSNGKKSENQLAVSSGIDKVVNQLVTQSRAQITQLYQERMTELFSDENSPLLKDLNAINGALVDNQLETLITSNIASFLPTEKIN